MLAFTFLNTDATGPFDARKRPKPTDATPGAWFDGEFACRTAQLSYWCADELWEVELDGHLGAGRFRMEAERARLVRRLDGWDAVVHRELAWESATHARDVVRAALRTAGHLPEAELLNIPAQQLGTYSWGIGSLGSAGLAGAVGILGEAVNDLQAGQANLATYQCALAAGAAAAGGLNGELKTFEGGVQAERVWQSTWLADRLGLADSP